MQRLITKYGLAAHLAFLAVAPLFLSPICVLWLSPLAFVWLLMEPSRVGDEMLHEARRRVTRKLVRDPVTWLLLVVVIYTAIRWANGGVAMAYDAEAGVWSIHAPEMPLLPGSVKGCGAAEFAAAVVLFVVTLGCRHALGKSARAAFFFLLSFFLGCGALVLMALAASGDLVVRDLFVFHETMPVYIGVAFGVGLVCSTLALFYAFDRVWRYVIMLVALSLAANAAGLVLFSPVWTVCLFLIVEVVVFLYAFFYAHKTLVGAAEFKYLVVFSISIVLAGVGVMAILPEADLAAKITAVKTGALFPESYFALRRALSDLAFRVWEAHPWLGTGLGSFPLDLRFYATEADWKIVSVEQAYSLNGCWGLLMERGIVGTFFIVVTAIFLMVTYVRRCCGGLKRRVWPHPAAWGGLLVAIAVLVLAWFDSSLAYPGTLTLTAILLAVSAKSFPKERHNG